MIPMTRISLIWQTWITRWFIAFSRSGDSGLFASWVAAGARGVPASSHRFAPRPSPAGRSAGFSSMRPYGAQAWGRGRGWGLYFQVSDLKNPMASRQDAKIAKG